jgi:hypothetical protein
MENNTKIALGLAAAVVVGYIVYNKSKKPKVTKPAPNDFPFPSKIDACAKDPKSYECAVQKGGGGIIPRPIKDLQKLLPEEQQLQKQCVCDSYPCNCGASNPNGYGYPTGYINTDINCPTGKFC